MKKKTRRCLECGKPTTEAIIHIKCLDDILEQVAEATKEFK